MKHTTSIIIIGLIVMGITLLIFFAVIPEFSTIHWMALAFMILSEILTVVGYIAIHNYAKQTSALMLITGGYSTLALYFIISVIISTIFISGVGEGMNWLIVAHTVLLAIVSVVMIVLVNASKAASVQDSGASEARDNNTPKRGGI